MPWAVRSLQGEARVKALLVLPKSLEFVVLHKVGNARLDLLVNISEINWSLSSVGH